MTTVAKRKGGTYHGFRSKAQWLQALGVRHQEALGTRESA